MSMAGSNRAGAETIMRITLYDGKFARDHYEVPTEVATQIYDAMAQSGRDWGDPEMMAVFTGWVDRYSREKVPGYGQTVAINYPTAGYLPSSFQVFDTLNIAVMGRWRTGWDSAVFASRSHFADMKYMFNVVSDIDGYFDADDPFDLEDDVLPDFDDEDFDDLSGREKMLNIMRGLIHKLKASCLIGSNWVILYSGERLLHVLYACEDRLAKDPYLVDELLSSRKYAPLYAQAVTESVQDLRRLSLAILGASEGRELVTAFLQRGAQFFADLPKGEQNTVLGPPPDTKDATELTIIWQEFLTCRPRYG